MHTSKSMTSRRKPVDRTEFILQSCAGKSVLHLGCTNYPYTEVSLANEMLLHSRIDAVSTRLVGIDNDREGIELLKGKVGGEIFLADLEHLEDLEFSDVLNVIIAGEIIEHLNNPGLFLNGVKRFMSPESTLVLTTINAYSAMRFLYYGVRGRGGVAEPVHPDHVAYYSYSTLKLLLERHGMRVDNILFYDLGHEHRPHNRWFLNLANDIGVRIASQWSDGLIAVCRLDQ
jgi:SAM-dependent methyltransferase